jgi:hypothetical protein
MLRSHLGQTMRAPPLCRCHGCKPMRRNALGEQPQRVNAACLISGP